MGLDGKETGTVRASDGRGSGKMKEKKGRKRR